MSVSELLRDLSQLGITLEAHGDLLRFSPKSAITPELADRMKAQKGGLLKMLRRKTPNVDAPSSTSERLLTLAERVRRQGVTNARRHARQPKPPRFVSSGRLHEPCGTCGGLEYFDVAIHNGKSIRRDCACCGRFVAFTKWNGRNQNGWSGHRAKAAHWIHQILEKEFNLRGDGASGRAEVS